MYETHKLSGKFSLEYLVHLFEFLENHGSQGDHFTFSQNEVEQLKVSYDAGTDEFLIKILQPISEAQLDLILKSHSLKRVQSSNETIDKQTLSTDFFVNIARAMIFGPNTLLNAEEAFELDFQSADAVFSKAVIGSQYIHAPTIQIFLLLLWAGYEFIKFAFFTDRLYFNIGNIDLIEGLLFTITCFFFWGLRPNTHKTLDLFDDIPVFREGTSDHFTMHKIANRGAIKLMIIQIFASVFTS